MMTRTHFKSILEQLVIICDDTTSIMYDTGTTAVDLLHLIKDREQLDVASATTHSLISAGMNVLAPHTTPELDMTHLAIELLEVAGNADDDLYND